VPQRRPSFFLVSFGVLLLAFAAAIRVIVVPVLSQLPADFDRTSQLEGTAQVLDPATLQLTPAAPITAERQVKVTQTLGDVAVVDSTLTVTTPKGESSDTHTYALDRADFGQADAPAGVTVEDQKGAVTIAHSLHPTKAPFEVYDAATRTGQEVTYTKTDELGGRSVYEYAGESTAPVANPALLEKLHAGIVGLAKSGDGTTLPKPLLEGVAAKLGGEKGAALAGLLTKLPEDVPLAFTATNDLSLAIDSQLGVPIRTAQTQTVVVNIDAGSQLVPLTALSKTTLASTDQSVQTSADNAAKTASKLKLLQSWIPLVLSVGGALALVFGLLRRKDEPAAPAGATQERELASV
jgi:DUF3068 family protein